MRTLRRLCLLICLTLLVVTPVAAQSSGRITLMAPDVSHFPQVQLTFTAYDDRGGFLYDLTQSEIQVTEDGQKAEVLAFTRQQPGLHFIAAFNAGPAMAGAVPAAPSRLESLRAALVTWMKSQPNTSPDEFSLVTNAGTQATRLSDPAKWQEALAAYTPDLARAQPSLTSLTTALDLASDPSRKPNSRRAVLYITTPLPDAGLAGLPNLADRAAQLGVRVNVWLVQAPGSDTRSSKALSDLAARTGGQVFVYTGTEGVPDVEADLHGLRYVFVATYNSLARSSGSHTVQLGLLRSEFSSPVEQRFSLSLQAPNPIFLSPPATLKRTWEKSSPQAKSALTPVKLELSTLVEFPDGIRRPLKASRLYVDGVLVSELTQEPFSPLVWKLDGITRSGRHLLRVEVEDTFGFKNASIEAPVEVNVAEAVGFDLETLIEPLRPYLPIAGAGAAALLALGLGVLAWRRFNLGARLRRRPARVEDATVAQPAAAPRRARTFSSPNAPARLVRQSEASLPVGATVPHAGSAQFAGGVIALSQPEVSIGSDPDRCDCLLDSTTVDGLHARIRHTPEGTFWLQDAGSVAGTWVNGLAVAPEGQTLHHGDTIQFGSETYRFMLKSPPTQAQIVATSYIEEA